MSGNTCLVWIIGLIVVPNIVGEIINRIIRHLNIRKAGWPPAHCDADGDAVEEDK